MGLRDQTVSQIDVLPSLRKVTAVSGEAGQNYVFKQAESRVNQTELAKYQPNSGNHADKHDTFCMDNQFAKPQSNGAALLKK